VTNYESRITSHGAAAMLLLAAGLTATAQDAPEIVDKMDAALGGFKDATCQVRGHERGGWFPLAVQDAVRVRIKRTGEAELTATFDEREIIRGRCSYSASFGAEHATFTVRPHANDAPLHLRARCPMKALAEGDFMVLPTAYPIRLFLDEPLLYYAMAPKRYFALVPELKVVEPLDSAGGLARDKRDVPIVLSSRVLIREPIKALAIPLLQSATLDRRFVIDPKTHRLERMAWRIDLGRGQAGTISASRVLEWNDRGLPTKIEVRETAIQRNRLFERKPYVRTVAYESIDSGWEMAAPPADVAYADAILKSPSAYKDDTADAHASVAASRLWVKRVVAGLLDTGAKVGSDEKALEPLHAQAKLTPKDPVVLMNLLALEHDKEKRAAVVEMSRAAGHPELAIARAALDPEKALEELAGARDLPEFARGAETALSIAALVRAGRAMEAAKRVANVDDLALADGPALGDALLKSEAPPEQALIALAWKTEERERRVKLLEKLLAGRPSAAVLEQAARLAWVAKAEGLAPALGAHPYGALLRGKPKEALAGLAKGDAALAGEVSGALGAGEDHDATLEACRAYFRLDQSDTWWGEGSGGPYWALMRVFAARKKPEEIARAVGSMSRDMYTRTQWNLRLVMAGHGDESGKAALAYAGANPKSAEILALSRLMTGDPATVSPAQVLEAAVGAGAEDAAVHLELALVSEDRRSADLYAKWLSKAPAGELALHAPRAVRAAVMSGRPEMAREFAKLLPAEAEGDHSSLAEMLARAEAFERAEAVVGEMENRGRKPLVLRGMIAELRKDYESAARWYNRDVREGGDRMGEVSGGAARAALAKAIGEDWFVERMLAGAAPALSAEDEREARRLFEHLTSEEITARDEAESELTKRFGWRAAWIVKAGLQSKDDDVKTRVRALLRKWAEPQ